MPRKQIPSLLFPLVIAGLLLISCVRSESKALPTSNLASTKTLIPLPIHTPFPSLVPTSNSIEMETDEPEGGLDLVIFGDSTLWGVGEYYASYIEEDFNKPVRLHDMWQGSLSAVALLKNLKENEMVREAVQKAEFVVYFGNPVGSLTGDWECIAPPYYVTDCSPETFTGYQETLEAIVLEILDLREGEPTVIRATDFYVPIMSSWRNAGIEDACTICLENMNEAVHSAAAEQNLPVAHVFDSFNGPEHGEDPRDKGYIGPDGIHTSDLGRITIATLLRELGFEPVTP